MQRNLGSNRRLKLLAIAGPALIFASIAPVAGVARSMQCAPVSQDRIEAQFKRFNDSWRTRDPGKVTALFAHDAVLLATVSNRPRTTPAQVRDYFDHFLLSRPVAKIDTSTIRIGCNMATRVGTWTIALTDAKTHEKSDVHARYTFVYKFSGGQWWIEHLHSSLMPEVGTSGH